MAIRTNSTTILIFLGVNQTSRNGFNILKQDVFRIMIMSLSHNAMKKVHGVFTLTVYLSKALSAY